MKEFLEDQERRNLRKLAGKIVKKLEMLNDEFASQYKPLQVPWIEVYQHMAIAMDGFASSTSKNPRLREDYGLYKHYLAHYIADVSFAVSKLQRILDKMEPSDLKAKLQEIYRQIENVLEEHRQEKVRKYVRNKMTK